MDSIGTQSLFATELHQMDQECAADNLGITFFQQATAGFHRATGRQQIVDEQDTLARLDAIDVHLQFVGAVFQFVGE